ncbi:hypothetical protein [Brevibacillus migulae]|nr:hypothetical protein [Brevibacillus migulae]
MKKYQCIYRIALAPFMLLLSTRNTDTAWLNKEHLFLAIKNADPNPQSRL